MFLPSQLVELSRRFQSDIEDLQVLLQEEGLPVQSAECLQQLSTRLGSDGRFRGDVAFLVQSMLGREQDPPGSMDVLGALVVAAAGTREQSDSPLHQQLMRELLRFVIQQRRPTAPAITPSAAWAERPAGRPTASLPHVSTGSELHSPDPLTDEHSPLGTLMRAEPEPLSRRVHAGWVAVAIAVLFVLGAGLMILRGSSKPATRELAARQPAPSAASPTYPAASEAQHGLLVPRSPHSSSDPRMSLPAFRGAGGRHAEQLQSAAQVTVPPSAPPKAEDRTEPAQKSPAISEPLSSSTGAPSRPQQESAAASLPASLPRARGIPGATDVSTVFAHTEAAAAEGQVPPPVFHPRDPVLIARNNPPADLLKSDLPGMVHMGSTGNMASSLMYSPEPEYPARAIAAGVQGEVKVRATVGPKGNVIDASIVSGPPLLRDAALEAVERWRYRPYEQDGKAVTIATTAILDFQLPRR